MAIKIPFVADVARFLSGTKDLEDSLDDVADSLDDISKAGADVDDKVGSDLKAVAKTADDSAEKIEKSFKDAFKSVEAQGRTSSKRVKDDVDDVGDKGSATLREFSQEAKANVAETVSSFDGSASSAVDAIQGTFGGLVSALGPAGIVGVAAAGVGIGLARSLFSKSQEAAEAFRERVLSIFEELRETGDITPEFKMDTLAGIVSDAKALQDAFKLGNLEDFQALLDQTGLSTRQLQTYFNGLTGDAGELTDAQILLEQQLGVLHTALVDPSATLEQQGQLRTQIEGIAALRVALDDQGNAYAEARGQQELLNRLMPSNTETTDDNTEAVVENTEALVDSIDAMRTQAGLRADAITSELDMKDALAAVTKAHKDNGDSLSKNTAAGRDNLRAIQNAMRGVEDYGDALVDQGVSSREATRKMREQEDVLVHKVARAFGISEKSARGYVKSLGGIPPAKHTKVTVTDDGTAAATRRKVDHAAADQTAKVTVSPDMTGVDADLNAWFSRHTYSVKVQPNVQAPRPGKSVPA